MSDNKFGYPSQVRITKIEIDGRDIIGIFQSVSIYEDIYCPTITGNLTICDTDGAGFIEKYGIEWIEPIEFTLESAQGESLEFKGVLNGIRNEVVKGSFKFYTCDFTSETMRKNEQTFVTDSYKDKAPEKIVEEMVKKMGGELKTKAKGQKLNYNGSRKRPADVIKYVLTHAVQTGADRPEATNNEGAKEEQAKGTTGFLCWQSMDEYKFESISDILSGKVGTNHTEFETKLANQSLDMDEAMKSIVQVEFRQLGDFQTKLRSGAFGSKLVSFDADTGTYKELDYYNRNNMTEKQKKAVPEGTVTRIFSKILTNQKFSNQCQKAPPNTGDQSRQTMTQNSGGQNTFSDQNGQMTLYPQFKFRAGDSIDIKVSKVKDEESKGGFDEKHSGKYVIQSVGHHAFADGKCYTRIKTIRSTTQQDDSSSQKDWAKGQTGRDV